MVSFVKYEDNFRDDINLSIVKEWLAIYLKSK